MHHSFYYCPCLLHASGVLFEILKVVSLLELGELALELPSLLRREVRRARHLGEEGRGCSLRPGARTEIPQFRLWRTAPLLGASASTRLWALGSAVPTRSFCGTKGPQKVRPPRFAGRETERKTVLNKSSFKKSCLSCLPNDSQSLLQLLVAPGSDFQICRAGSEEGEDPSRERPGWASSRPG